VYPCTYTVGPYWYIPLDSDSPTIISVGGAEVTIIEGDGTQPVFRVSGYPERARIDVHGFTFRNVSEVFEKGTDDGSTMIFCDNVVEDCSSGLDATWVWSGSRIAGNRICRNGGAGINIYHCWADIEDNEICFNTGAGLSGVCCEEPQIRRNHIHHNGNYGIMAGVYCYASDNLIEDNSEYGVVYGWSCSLTGNTIRRNGVGMRTNSSQGFIQGNNIYDNDEYNVALYSSDAGVMDFTMNWWGTTDPDLISEGIHDCWDDPSVGVCAEFDPFCMQEGCAPTATRERSWGSIKAMYR
jgi:hypothetical protein